MSAFKTLYPFILALLLFALLDLSLTFTPLHEMIEARVENHLAHKFQALETEKSVDILAFGTSRTLHGFKTDVFEQASPVRLNAYNMGVVSGDYYVFQLMLEQYIKHHTKPKLVILEASDFIFNNDRMSDSNLLYLRTLLSYRPELYKTLLQSDQLSSDNKVELLLSSVSAVYRYRSLISPTILTHGMIDGQKKRNRLEEGWIAFADNVDENWRNKADEFASNRIRKIFSASSAIHQGRLIGFLNYCATQNIPVVMVAWPYHEAYREAFQKMPMSQTYQRQLAQVIKRYRLPFFQLVVSQTPTSFGDVDHLSESGAILTTADLAQKISSDPPLNFILTHQPQPESVLTRAD